MLSRIVSTCVPSPKAPICWYNQGSFSNWKAPLVWCYFFNFSSNITFSSGILSVIYIVMLSVCCWVTRVVPGFLNLPSVYFIRLGRFWSSYLLCILRTCVYGGIFPTSSSASSILVLYSMLISSAWFFYTFLPEYNDRTSVIISASLMLDVTCGNLCCSWVSCQPL